MRLSIQQLTLVGALLAGLQGFACIDVQAEDAQPVLSKQSIIARAGEHPDFDRIVFDWPRTTKYQLSRDGAHATLHFSASADVRFNGFTFLTRARGFAVKTDAQGNLTVTFAVDPRALLKDFTSGNSVAIDISGPAAPSIVPVAVQEKTQAPPDTAQAIVAPTLTPPTATAQATVPPAKIPVAAAAPISLLPKNDVVPKALAPVIAATPKPDISLPAAPIPSPPQAAVIKPPTGAPQAASKSSSVIVVGDTPLLAASLDPHIDTKAVIWQRGGYGYIVFDRKFTMSLTALTTGLPAPKVALEPFDLAKANGFRFPMPEEVSLHATREGTVWKIFLSHQLPDVPVSTSLVTQPDFALGARVLLPLTDAAEPLRLSDPIVGDDLFVLPMSQTEAFAVPRRMADFTILPAAQGLVIKPLTDKVVVRTVSDGIEVTAEGGLHLSTSNDTGASQQSTQKAKAAAAGKSMFDFAAWRGKPDETFTLTRQRLQQTIVDVPERERNRARLELVRFYFSHAEGDEALALLAWLAQQVPDLRAHADFLALDGASKILAYRPEEGLKDLDSPLLSGQPEIELWQAVAYAELRNWKDAEEKFAISENILAGYPEPFYSRFLVLAVESAVATDKVHEATDWLDRLETGPYQARAEPAIAYLHGVLHAKAGRAQAAEDAWKDVASSTDHLYKIRAELALIDLGVANGSLTAAQAADRLEALRFGWRGDDLEVDILHRLGQFYIQAHNIKAGLGTLSQAVLLYPASPLAPVLHLEMSQIFHDVFLGELGQKLSPLDALTLYQQYRSLMPTGADGIAVTRNLAERLVAIDLLQQAGDLIEDLVKNKLQDVDKGRASARLAAVRLLDHNPDAALTALTYSDGEFFPSDLQHERLLLRAKALSDLHRDDEALALLQNNSRESAKLLRADITMHAQHWGDAAKVLLELVGDPPKAGENLRKDQAEWLVNCAIAYSLAGDQTGLDKIAIDYSAAMAGTAQSDTFRLLTQPEKLGQLKDIAAAQTRIADVNLFQGFLDGYRKANIHTTPSVDSRPTETK